MPIPAVQRLRPLALGWLLSFGVFGLFAALLGAQVVLGAGHSVSDAVLFAGRDWLPWAVLAPVLVIAIFAIGTNLMADGIAQVADRGDR